MSLEEAEVNVSAEFSSCVILTTLKGKLSLQMLVCPEHQTAFLRTLKVVRESSVIDIGMGNTAAVVFKVPFVLTGTNRTRFERHYAHGSGLLE